MGKRLPANITRYVQFGRSLSMSTFCIFLITQRPVLTKFGIFLKLSSLVDTLKKTTSFLVYCVNNHFNSGISQNNQYVPYKIII